MQKIKISSHTTCTLPKENLSIEIPDYLHIEDKQQKMISTQKIKVKAFQYLILKGEKYPIISFVEAEKVIQITQSFAEFSWKKLVFGVTVTLSLPCYESHCSLNLEWYLWKDSQNYISLSTFHVYCIKFPISFFFMWPK